MTDRLKILVSGMVAGVPRQGGATWAVLQYLLGFRRLGHDVYFVEPVQEASLLPSGASLLRSENATYFNQVMSEFGFEQNAALLQAGTRHTVGMSYDSLCQVASSTDALINVSGMLTDEALVEKVPWRVYLDLDPAFTQLWHAMQGIDMGFSGHDRFVTVGQAVGGYWCDVPTCGLAWITTPQPLVLEYWPVAERMLHNALTTVANWRGYGSVEHGSVFYGQKAHSLRDFFRLPTLTDEEFVLALAIHPDERKDLEALRANGWRLIDPASVASTTGDYRRFIGASKAEFGIAKSGYVESRCGWFSDRSACYLASGRPVLAQETGFSRFLPGGTGLIPFTTIEEALDGIDEINGRYALHSRAAREIAEVYLDSDKVLTRLLENVDASR
jgi:hypothetical protein